MRIFLGLAEVSGFYSNLSKGFEKIGIESELITLLPHRFGYGGCNSSIWVRYAQWSVKHRLKNSNKHLSIRWFWATQAGISRALLLMWCILRFDVFVFCSASSFFKFHELPLLKLLGKKIIYNYHGTDSRCAFMDGFAEDIFMPSHMKEGTGYIGPFREFDNAAVVESKILAYQRITRLRKSKMEKVERYADVIINSPSHGQHHSRPFVQRLHIGRPYMHDFTITRKDPVTSQRDHVVILHSPSYPEGKGSPVIRSAVSSVQQKGHKIEYIEISGRPNREVLELIQECDFVIDQLYSDLAMAGFATEAAFFGKPAVVGGYYAVQQFSDISSEWIPPTLFCLPDEIEAAIEKMVVDAQFRKELGIKAQRFVEERWIATKCAERMLALIKDDYPREWLYAPSNCKYISGMGLSRENLHLIVTGMHERFGMDGFLLSDKPELEKLITDIIKKPTSKPCLRINMSEPKSNGI